jgi:hypothetical protein
MSMLMDPRVRDVVDEIVIPFALLIIVIVACLIGSYQ